MNSIRARKIQFVTFLSFPSKAVVQTNNMKRETTKFFAARRALKESFLRRLGTQILKAAGILGAVLVRLLEMAFYLEISLLKSLNRPHASQHERRDEIDSSSENPVCKVPLLPE